MDWCLHFFYTTFFVDIRIRLNMLFDQLDTFNDELIMGHIAKYFTGLTFIFSGKNYDCVTLTYFSIYLTHFMSTLTMPFTKPLELKILFSYIFVAIL